MGLIAHIYKTAGLGDCSNGGLSGKVDEVTIVNADGPFEPTLERPAVMIVPGYVRGTVHAVPAIENQGMFDTPWLPAREHWMHGGTFIGSSDARFSECIFAILHTPHDGSPIAFHDRTETPEEYRMYSA